MRRRPPRSTRTDTLFPYTALFRSERADFRAEPESLLAVVAAAGSAAGRETRLQNLPDGHHDDDAEDHFEWIHVRFSPFSLSSVERIGGPVVAQLVDLVGNRDALVGGDPFEQAHPLLEPLGMRRILRCLFRGLHALDFHLTLLELQPALEHEIGRAHV